MTKADSKQKESELIGEENVRNVGLYKVLHFATKSHIFESYSEKAAELYEARTFKKVTCLSPVFLVCCSVVSFRLYCQVPQR